MLLRTDNKRQISWVKKVADPGGGNIIWKELHFIGATSGWIIGEERTIYHTDKSRETWTKETTGALK